jgi:hypothetical protein
VSALDEVRIAGAVGGADRRPELVAGVVARAEVDADTDVGGWEPLPWAPQAATSKRAAAGATR